MSPKKWHTCTGSASKPWRKRPHATFSASSGLMIMRNLLIGSVCYVVAMFAHAGAYEDILTAANNDDTATVVGLLQRGMDVNTADRTGTTLVMIAARNGNMQLLQTLLARRANVNRRNQHGDTALLMAAIKPAPDAAKALIENGAELNPDGWTPLHYAVFSGSTEVAAMLIAKGAKLDARAPNGQTALMLAVKQGKLELVQLLVNARADLRLTDSDGLTALGLAKKLDHSGMVTYLRRSGAVD
ncbi:MAG: ankyrin repeat domain-containing protein [Betaproteobacteria bacterium]|nr:ankyrin repeat domain-containing protein [Betaproteobacteria bacterium]